MQTATPGESITFGSYPHAADGTDRTPILWHVLHCEGGAPLLLSAAILDCRRYHGRHTDTTWQACDLRRWLNGHFYGIAFTPDEMAMIQTTHCTGNGRGTPTTHDKVFLLSADEAERLTAKQADGGGAPRRAFSTAYARARKPDGCSLYVYDKSMPENYGSENGAVVGCSWWWLRTQGNRPSRAYFVGTRGSIRSYGQVNLSRDGVRPALRLNRTVIP